MSGRGGYRGQQQQQSEEEMVMQNMMIKLTLSINRQCFTECVSSFKEEKLASGEISCIQSCAKRQSGAFNAMNDIGQQLQAKGGAAMF